MDRLIQQNVIAMSGRAVEAAGDVNTLLLDKTGTITLGNRQAVEFLPVTGVTVEELADRAQLSSLPDETPEGRSIVVLAKEKFNLRARTPAPMPGTPGITFVPFTATTRMSGVTIGNRQIRKGAGDAVAPLGPGQRDAWPAEIERLVDTRRPRGRHAAGRGGAGERPLTRTGGDLPQGCRQGRHARALRPAARDGHPHRHDHGRQSAHRGRDRARSGRRRLPGRGDAGGQDGADPA